MRRYYLISFFFFHLFYFFARKHITGSRSVWFIACIKPNKNNERHWKETSDSETLTKKSKYEDENYYLNQSTMYDICQNQRVLSGWRWWWIDCDYWLLPLALRGAHITWHCILKWIFFCLSQRLWAHVCLFRCVCARMKEPNAHTHTNPHATSIEVKRITKRGYKRCKWDVNT